MVTSELLLKLFDAASMQRWNDQIRPVTFSELDKQAHKLVVAYVLAKIEEENGTGVDWVALIEGGIFEFFQRLVLTDLKPQVVEKIRQDRAKYAELTRWAYGQLEPLLRPVGSGFCGRFRAHLEGSCPSREQRILNAAHLYATRWEFRIVKEFNRGNAQSEEVDRNLQLREEGFYGLAGMRSLVLSSRMRRFVDLCGRLRFQIRWSHVHRVPQTSVLGHMFLVATITYLLVAELGACRRRRVNDFLTGLFHDLPEVLTRDIINPVKRSVAGLSALIKAYEKEEMEERIYSLIPSAWRSDMELFTSNEFSNVVVVGGQRLAVSAEDITERYNQDESEPRDGELIKAVDDLAAFIEAYLARHNGIQAPDLYRAEQAIRAQYYRRKIGGVDLAVLYSGFH